MKLRYTYPVKSTLVLTEHWAIRVGGIEIAWGLTNQLATALQATISLGTDDKPPTVKKSAKPGVSWDVDLGIVGSHGEVERAVRTIWGLVSLFTTIDIDFESVERTWIPETEAEKDALKISRFSAGIKLQEDAPRAIGFDLVARAMLSSIDAADFEVPLGFLRRGMRATRDGEYVDAFYSYFFFLETLYAPGFSSPAKVKAKLWDAKPVRDALISMRTTLPVAEFREGKGASLLALSNQQILERLVDVRGELHHHALRRPGVWHPDKPSAYREEAIMLGDIVHKIARDQAFALMFDARRDEALMSSAAGAGALTRIRIAAFELTPHGERELPPVTVTLPAVAISTAAVDATNRLLRDKYANTNVEIVRYELRSEDGETVYASWRRNYPK
ncbi:MAG TPA: hypothetical protein VFE23_10750 [Usitatibacter sp.]|jgi:hypothetical protein|nr:hypothetical protein [Usitatibacter sp.]